VSDVADCAQGRNAHYLSVALDAAKAPPEPAQNVINGEILCIDCDAPIEPLRLKAKPNAARCVECQGCFEEWHGC